MTPADIQTLGTAVAGLKLKCGAAWRHAVAAAARRMFLVCNMQQLVQLLLGVTAGGFNPHEPWWRGWFAATMQKYELLFGAHTGSDWAPAAVGAADQDSSGEVAAVAVDADDDYQGSSGLLPPQDDSSSSNQQAQHAKPLLEFDSKLQHESDQQQRQQQPVDALPAALFSTVCLVLQQLGRQVHPLWMAGMLETYLR
jgi:hypothetical protein